MVYRGRERGRGGTNQFVDASVLSSSGLQCRGEQHATHFFLFSTTIIRYFTCAFGILDRVSGSFMCASLVMYVCAVHGG